MIKVAEQTEEYRAFGPWIYEIDQDHAIPDQFEGVVDKTDDSLMMIKIPVNKERRDLKPGMLMYDQLLCLYNDHLFYAKYNDSKIHSYTISYNDVVALENSITLLLGEFTVFTAQEVFRFKYNTVSWQVINKLAGVIRERMPVQPAAVKKTGSDSEEHLDFFFTNLITQIKSEHKEFKLLAWQPKTGLHHKKQNFFIKLYEKLTAPMLQPSMHLCSSSELLIVSRARAVHKKSDENYNYRYLYIPLGRINRITLNDSEKYSNIKIFSIKTGKHDFSFLTESARESFQYFRELH
jgi:hypothetical protein